MIRPRYSHSSGRSPRAGLTLIEVLLAVTLLSLLMVGIMMSIRLGLNSMSHANVRLMSNRRVTGAQRILEQQLAGFIPVITEPVTIGGVPQVPFFQGEPQAMRFVSTYSLQGASRGLPQILEFTVIPGRDGRGFRLIVNEQPYVDPRSAGAFVTGVDQPMGPNSEVFVHFTRIAAAPTSFVLSDKLARCNFTYFDRRDKPLPPQWVQVWGNLQRWPAAVRIDMQPLDPDPAGLHVIPLTAPIHIRKSPMFLVRDY